jgi:hypothetical protein
MEVVVFAALLYLAYRMTHTEVVVSESPAPSATTTEAPRTQPASRVPHANMRPHRVARVVDPCVDCTTGGCDGCPHSNE